MVVSEVVRKSRLELVDSIPKALIYAGTAFVIWMFTKFLFVPLGQTTLWGGLTASKVIVLISLVTILVIVLKILKELRDICDAFAGLIAYAIDKDTVAAEFSAYQQAVRSVMYVLIVAVMFLFFGSLLHEIHPALSGLVLIVVFLWSVAALYSAGILLSEKIEVKVKKAMSHLFSIEQEKKPKPQ